MITPEVFQAWLDGKPIQIRTAVSGTEWVDFSRTVVDRDRFLTGEFRIKPSEQRDFAGAIKWLLEGKKVRLSSWIKGDYWVLRGQHIETVDERKAWMHVHFLTATDWEVAPRMTDPIIKVRRIITYEGPRSKVEAHLAKRFRCPGRGFDPGRITEEFEGDSFDDTLEAPLPFEEKKGN